MCLPVNSLCMRVLYLNVYIYICIYIHVLYKLICIFSPHEGGAVAIEYTAHGYLKRKHNPYTARRTRGSHSGPFLQFNMKSDFPRSVRSGRSPRLAVTDFRLQLYFETDVQITALL